jgi:hypothetical protein
LWWRCGGPGGGGSSARRAGRGRSGARLWGRNLAAPHRFPKPLRFLHGPARWCLAHWWGKGAAAQMQTPRDPGRPVRFKVSDRAPSPWRGGAGGLGPSPSKAGLRVRARRLVLPDRRPPRPNLSSSPLLWPEPRGSPWAAFGASRAPSPPPRASAGVLSRL